MRALVGCGWCGGARGTRVLPVFCRGCVLMVRIRVRESVEWVEEEGLPLPGRGMGVLSGTPRPERT